MSANVGGQGVNLNIMITPFLDMAFQLLAFFVMTYHPHAIEGHIDGKLLPPSKIETAGNKAKDPNAAIAPIDPDDEKSKDNLTVLIKAVPKGQTEGTRKEGDPTRIQLKRPESPGTPETIADNDVEFATGLKVLGKELERAQKSPGGAQTAINIEADPDLRQQYVVQVYDVCKAAGYRTVGFVPPPLNAQGR